MKKWLILAVFCAPLVSFGAYNFIPKEYKSYENISVIKTSGTNGSASEDVRVWRVDDEKHPQIKCYIAYQFRAPINSAYSGESDLDISCVTVK